MQPGDKKALAILGGIALLVALVVVGTTTALVWGHSKSEDPHLSLAAGRNWERIPAQFWCTAELTECTNPQIAADDSKVSPSRFPVAIDEVLTLSVPAVLSDGVWSLQVVYATPSGVQEETTMYSGDRSTVQLTSRGERVLLGITVVAPGYVETENVDSAGERITEIKQRGKFVIDALPEGYKIPNDNVLPPIEH